MHSGQGQEPPGLGPHTQGTWYRRYGKIQNRRYVNYQSIANCDFLCLCGKLHSKTTACWKCWRVCKDWSDRETQRCSLPSVQLYGWHYRVNEEGVHNYETTAETGAEKKGKYRLHVLGMTSRHSCGCSSRTCGMKRRNEVSKHAVEHWTCTSMYVCMYVCMHLSFCGFVCLCLHKRNNYSQGRNRILDIQRLTLKSPQHNHTAPQKMLTRLTQKQSVKPSIC